MNALAGAAVADPAQTPGGERAATRAAALQFEALFLQQLIQRMRESQLESGFFGKGAGSNVYDGIFDRYLSESLAAESPLGLADLLVEQWSGEGAEATPVAHALERIQSLRAGSIYEAVTSAGSVGLPLASPARPGLPATPAAPAPAAILDRISRKFGWGRDPIDGSRRFHGGVDLPAATGTPVRAAAPGRVTEAGVRGGYGLQVVVEHPDGLITRYAHLSRTDVRRGDLVGRGDSLGEVGSTGRSTGPHLHFEVFRGERKLDPIRTFGNPLRPQVLGDAADPYLRDGRGTTLPAGRR